MSENLGPRLRAAREARGVSLRTLAANIGVSPSLLSQVETGKTKPSVSTLYALVSHLGISTDALLGRVKSPATAIPATDSLSSSPTGSGGMFQKMAAAEHPALEMENGVRWEKLAVLPGVDVEALRVTYQPRGSSTVEGHLMRHLGVEHFTILSGELTLHLGFDTHIIRAGDSAALDSRQPHMFVNHTDEPAIGIWYIMGRNSALEQSPGVIEAVESGAVARELSSPVDVLRAFRD